MNHTYILSTIHHNGSKIINVSLSARDCMEAINNIPLSIHISNYHLEIYNLTDQKTTFELSAINFDYNTDFIKAALDVLKQYSIKENDNEPYLKGII